MAAIESKWVYAINAEEALVCIVIGTDPMISIWWHTVGRNRTRTVHTRHKHTPTNPQTQFFLRLAFYARYYPSCGARLYNLIWSPGSFILIRHLHWIIWAFYGAQGRITNAMVCLRVHVLFWSIDISLHSRWPIGCWWSVCMLVFVVLSCRCCYMLLIRFCFGTLLFCFLIKFVNI